MVKTRGVRVQAKTFTLPDVQVGGIIEYRYKLGWDVEALLNTTWYIQHELYTRKARLALKPYSQLNLMWINFRLPGGVRADKAKDGYIRLELEDVAPFPEEAHMPPENELKARVSFYYRRTDATDPDQFWSWYAKDRSEMYDSYIGKRKGIEREAQSLVSPGDDAETKLRKLYARVQQIRNLTYERDRTAQEEKREKLKENNHIEDVLNRGYGYGIEINWLFVGLCRALGLDASLVRTASRRSTFFKKELLDTRQFNSELVLVRAGEKEYWLDPGLAYAPFGMLAWIDTGTNGLVINKAGGVFVVTPQPGSSTAVTERRGTLRLEPDGTLAGKVEVLFRGQEAIWRRLDAMESDDEGRRKDIQDEIKEWLPSAAKVDIEKIEGWEGREEPLRVEFKLTIPEFASATGRRLLLPVGVFQAGQRNPFTSATRIHPVYFRHPFQEVDDITIELPPGMQVESAPPRRAEQPAFAVYQVAGEANGPAVRIRRQFTMEGFYFRTEYYPQLRSFYDKVRAGDEQQIVLRSAAAGNGK